MPDITLNCENCGNEFVFSEGERAFYASKGLSTPKCCPICRSIKAQEKRIPPKPTSPTGTTPSSGPAVPPEFPKKA